MSMEKFDREKCITEEVDLSCNESIVIDSMSSEAGIIDARRKIAMAFGHFCKDALISDVRVLSGGAINGTFLVMADTGRFIVQSLSGFVFGDRLNRIERNYKKFKEALTDARAAGDVTLAVPEWIADSDGRYIWRDQDGRAWRIYPYLAGSAVKYDDPENVRAAARALSEMHRILGYYEGKPETVIPDFHRIELYYENYRKTIEAFDNSDDCNDSQPAGRNCVKKCNIVQDGHLEELITENIDYIMENCVVEGDAVIHGDTKLDNILIDETTGCAAFIDLDTFSVGSPLVDVADSVRSILSYGDDSAENEPSPVGDDSAAAAELPFNDQNTAAAELPFNDQSQLPMDTMDLFIDEYYKASGRDLGYDEQHDLMHMIIRMPFELGLRFYTDHLRGNTYFPVEYNGENLVRARKQFELFNAIRQS